MSKDTTSENAPPTPTRTFEPIEVLVPVGSLLFPHIYDPVAYDRDARPRYGARIPLGLLWGPLQEEAWSRLVTREGEDGVDTVWVSSSWRPEVDVLPPQTPRPNVMLDRLVAELQRLDARNVSRDRVFEGRTVRLTLQPCEYELRGRTGLTLVLTAVHLYL